MRKGIILGVILLAGLHFRTSALNNEKKTIEAQKVTESPRIDGVLDDPVWENAILAGDFIQYEPYNGKSPTEPTYVRIVYDNHAIYVGAFMKAGDPNSIIRDLSERDAFDDANADLFTVIINTFNDGVNAVEFMVSAAGVQSDGKHTGNNGDSNWDAVWESAVNITEDGWVAEMKIPYSALRFSNQDNQTWGIHFFRHIRHNREWSSWNYVDNHVEGFINQMGEISGIKDINPPLRLSVTPYISGYMQNEAAGNNWERDFNAGMDLKWGINQSFTLDMILIPDFGQVQSDEQVLNLSPYEVKYNEKRSFFTEGTELFNKANIFYSRRIGSKPKDSREASNHLLDNEIVQSNPSETQLINATKISGRTSGGLGVGFINAMTSAADAVILDTISNTSRQYRTQGFTNYNMIVLDQTLKNNSYISLANTNVLHAEENYTANVSGTEFKVMNKENSYQIFGRGAISQKYTESNSFGHYYYLELSKTKGNFTFDISHNTESHTYDPNDFGYIQQNNESTWGAEFSYDIKKPFWKVLNWENEISMVYSSLYKPRKYSDFAMAFRSHTTFAKQHLSTGVYFEVNPFNRYDYFEARAEGWQYNRHKMFNAQTWISTDYRKKLAFDLRPSVWKAFDYDQYGYNINAGPRIRFSDKWLFIYSAAISTSFNTYGYVNKFTDELDNTVIHFGERDQYTITNTINSSYIFTDKMSLNLKVRHYWSRVEYTDFYQLLENGELSPAIDYNIYGTDANYNYNAFTIDMQYKWRFAPGSELSLVWKNAIYTNQAEIINNFWENLDNTLESSQINSISLKVLYYLDYHYFKRK